MSRNELFFLSSALYFVIVACTFHFTYSIQPTELIDEVFHVNQAKQYCDGSFDKWDPKITTLPGLYLISVAALKLYSLVTGTVVCNIYSLRFINVVAGFCRFFVLYLIIRQLQPKAQNPEKTLLSAFTISLFPVLYFFDFFYYTEALSTLLVLIMYLFHLKHSYWSAAITGAIAVFTRQTNIVWVCLMVFDLFGSLIEKPNKSLSGHESVNTLNETLTRFINLYHNIWSMGFKKGLQEFWNIHSKLMGYAFVICAFSLFVLLNGGLVVGDKTAHQAVVHIPQLFYYALFTFGFALPHFVRKTKIFLIVIIENITLSFICTLLFLLIVHFNTMVHPYLLADNRHYTFYIWKRLYERNEVYKYVLVSLYLFCMYCVLSSLNHKSLMFQMGYWLSVFVCLVPQKLLEYRYFILPFIFLRLHMKDLTWSQLIQELLFFVIINCSSLYIFRTKEFYWTDLPGPQRIIW